MPEINNSIRFIILDDALLSQLEQHQIKVLFFKVAFNQEIKQQEIEALLRHELNAFFESKGLIGSTDCKEQQLSKGFSDRDLQVLHSLCDGLTSKEIGEKLHLSKKTIDLIRTKLLRTYDVKTSNELIRLSTIDGLYTPRTNEAIQAEKDRLAQEKLERRKMRLQGG